MAVYHFAAKVISRGQGQSAVAAAAYQSRECLFSQQDGDAKDYRQKAGQDVLFSGLYAPKDAPDWTQDREQLWNRAEQAEKRKDAQLARGFDLALMAELTPEQNRYALQDFVRESFTRGGYVADVAIHSAERGGDARNIHAHILTTLRPIEGGGFAAKKDRNQNTKETLAQWREAWAQTAARHLRRHGHKREAERMAVSHLTLGEQRAKAIERGDLEHADALAREATQHLGAKATRMERDGVDSLRGAFNREVEAENRRNRALRKGLEQTEREIAQLEAEIRRQDTGGRVQEGAQLPRQHHEPSRKTEAGRAFAQASKPETPPLSPTRHNTEQRQAFNQAATSHQETGETPPRASPVANDWNQATAPPQSSQTPPEASQRRQGEGRGDAAPAPKPSNQNRRQTIRTAEEMRERMKQHRGQRRTRKPGEGGDG